MHRMKFNHWISFCEPLMKVQMMTNCISFLSICFILILFSTGIKDWWFWLTLAHCFLSVIICSSAVSRLAEAYVYDNMCVVAGGRTRSHFRFYKITISIVWCKLQYWFCVRNKCDRWWWWYFFFFVYATSNAHIRWWEGEEKTSNGFFLINVIDLWL